MKKYYHEAYIRHLVLFVHQNMYENIAFKFQLNQLQCIYTDWVPQPSN
jgi:hypothetical protein